jgi:hypothetical protein
VSQRIVIIAILVAAIAVPAFDYAITRVGDDVRAGRLASFDTITAGTAPAPYRYRVLVPYAIAPLVALADRVWPHDVSVHRIDAIFVFTALAAMLWSLCLYLRNWYPAPLALIGVLLVAATMPIALRHHFYSPYSLVEPTFLILGLHAVYHGRARYVLILAVLASLNRETGILIPIALLVHEWRTRTYGRRFVTAMAGVGLSILTIAALRLSLGPAPESITLDAVRAINLSPEGFTAAATNVALFAGVTGWVLAAAGWRDSPEFVRQQAWIAALYLPIVAVFGVWYEVRLLMPLYPLLIPAIVAAVQRATS